MTMELLLMGVGDQEMVRTAHLVSMRQVTTVRKIQSHNALMWLQERSVNLEVGW